MPTGLSGKMKPLPPGPARAQGMVAGEEIPPGPGEAAGN